jgi:hypothetical protein
MVDPVYQVAYEIMQRALDQATVLPSEDYARTLDRVKTTLEVGLAVLPPPTQGD